MERKQVNKRSGNWTLKVRTKMKIRTTQEAVTVLKSTLSQKCWITGLRKRVQSYLTTIVII